MTEELILRLSTLLFKAVELGISAEERLKAIKKNDPDVWLKIQAHNADAVSRFEELTGIDTTPDGQT